MVPILSRSILNSFLLVKISLRNKGRGGEKPPMKTDYAPKCMQEAQSHTAAAQEKLGEQGPVPPYTEPFPYLSQIFFPLLQPVILAVGGNFISLVNITPQSNPKNQSVTWENISHC